MGITGVATRMGIVNLGAGWMSPQVHLATVPYLSVLKLELPLQTVHRSLEIPQQRVMLLVSTV